MPQAPEPQIERDRVMELSEALESGSLYQVRQLVTALPTAGIAHLLESSPPKTRSVLWQLIDKEAEGEVLQYLNEDIQNDILSELSAREVAELTEGLEADDQADILQQLPEQLTAEVLQEMDQQDRLRVENVLSYAEDTAGGLMNTDAITVRQEHTVDVVLRYLRRHESIPEMTDNIQVVNREDSFIGILPLRTLLVSAADTTVREIMRTDIDPLPVALEASQVALLFEQNDWVSAPVIDEEGKLLGRITIDDVVDVIKDNADHSLMSMAGMDEEDDTFAPVVKSARRRAVWLGVNLMTAVLASFVIYLFQDTLDQVVYLAVLMPIVANMGGVAGTQTLTLVIRGMALGHLSAGNSRWLLLREMGVAGLNGILWALVVGIITLFWYKDWLLGVIIGLAMIINLLTSAVAGAFLPLALRRVNIDPALAGSVALTTVTDSVGFFVFLGLAQWLYL